MPDALARGLRHAGHDRRRPVEPHAPGGGGRRQARHEVPARAGELGQLARRRLRPGRQHPDEPRPRRAGRAGRRGLRHRLQGELGERARGRARGAAASPMRSPPAPRTTRSAASASSASPRRCGRRRRSSASASTTSSSARSPAARRPAWSSASPPTAAPTASSASTARRRRRRRSAQILRIAQRTADLVELGRPITRGRRRARHALRLSRTTALPSAETLRRDPALGAARRHDDRPGLRGEIDAGHDRHDRRAAKSRPARRCSMPISAACRRSTATATLFRNG